MNAILSVIAGAVAWVLVGLILLAGIVLCIGGVLLDLAGRGVGSLGGALKAWK